VRCARCGNENSDENRFCGMCGATLLAAAVPVASTPAQGAVTGSTAVPSQASSAPAPPRNPTAGRAPAPDESPAISGPSFLGLNEPAPAARRRGSLSIDPNSPPGSSNLDYLLHDDEEETKRGGAGKYVLILLALALAAGFGYLRWKNQGFPRILGTSKPAAAQNSDAPDAGTTPPQPANSASVPLATPASAPATAPATATAAPTGTNTPAQPAAGSASPAAGAPAAATTNPDSTNITPPANSPPDAAGAAPPNAAANDPTPNSPAEATTPSPAPTAKQPAASTADTAAATNSEPHRAAAARPSPPKPSPAIKPGRAIDAVSEAQKYIYGRGVTQDCDRGMRLLKPAADQANPRAMVEMGALYSAGLCTPHDLPTAYRWFALALRKDPDNQSVQTDLEKLWREMTQPERQLAIKLSQ